MTNDEIAEVISKGQNDGATLYRVVDALYHAALIFTFVIGAAGVVLTFTAVSNGNEGQALVAFFVTTVICAILYAVIVIGSHSLKVLVHILFANLVILDRSQNEPVRKT